MAENIQNYHTSLLKENLLKNSARIVQTKQVIEQFENQITLFKELPSTLKKSVLIPIGRKGFLRGHIVHTNELYHNVGCGYMIKRTSKQSIDFCNRMLNETNNFLSKLYDEENWLNNQLKLPNLENAFGGSDQIEIIENYDENLENEWKIKHRERVKKMKQDESKEREKNLTESDEDLFSRLNQLELLEELEEATEIERNLEIVELSKETFKSKKEFEEFINKDYNKLDVNNDKSIKNILEVAETMDNEKSHSLNNLNCDVHSCELQMNSMNNPKKVLENDASELQMNSMNNLKKIPENEIKEQSVTNDECNSFNTSKQLECKTRGNVLKNRSPEIESNESKNLESRLISDNSCISSSKCEIEKEQILNNIPPEKKSEIDLTFQAGEIKNCSGEKDSKNNLETKSETSRILEIEKELELTRKNKTEIRTEEDLMKRLDEIEKEENLLEEMELLEETTECLKKNTIRFNEQVRTNFYDSSEAVTEPIIDSSDITNQLLTQSSNVPDSDDDNEPITLEIKFSHSNEESTTSECCDDLATLKPSDLYDMPYRPKSILKNKNRLFEEPQHTGEIPPSTCNYMSSSANSSTRRKKGIRNWACYDTFSKNGNDSDQENANIVQVPPPLSEVKEKNVDMTNSPIPVTNISNVPVANNKRQSRFLVSRALITKK